MVLNPLKWFRRVRIKCAVHGDREFTIACIHICKAIDSKKQVGFHWDMESADQHPEAWCDACDKWIDDHPESSLDDVMAVADFQRLCVRCWDEAKTLLYRI